LGRRIAGRQAGVHLNEQGRAQAGALASRLAGIKCEAIYSSPMERARETASAITRPLRMDFTIEEGLNEIDYGAWTGKTFDDLNLLPGWHQYNAVRDTAEIPGGEKMMDLRTRAENVVQRLRRVHQSVVILVTHADCIRAIGATHTKVSLDAFQSFEVLPASVNVIRVEDWGCKVLLWNDTGETLPTA
jgi:broad specificity phosphatase PhoE